MSTPIHRYRAPRKRLHVVPRQFDGPVTDPFEGTFTFGHQGRRRWTVSLLVALALQGGLMGVAYLNGLYRPRVPIHREVVATVLPKPKPVVPPVIPPPEPPPPKPQQRQARTATPPPPTQAAKVISATPDPSQPLDLGDFAMVTGTATTFSGGMTSTNGPSKKAVPDTRPTARVAPRPPAPVAPSQAKPAHPSRDDWSCTWPDEEQDSDLNDAHVVIRVVVDRDGSPQSVEVLNAPKPSFAEAARRCGMSESFQPALDAVGQRIPGPTSPFLVHFVR
jgi:outer membrane biosynthesis protein TonB